jgi:hypothetical protein
VLTGRARDAQAARAHHASRPAQAVQDAPAARNRGETQGSSYYGGEWVTRDIRLKVEVLELFAETQSEHYEAITYRQQEGYVPVIKHDRAKRAWREANKDKQRIYAARNYAKKYAKART